MKKNKNKTKQNWAFILTILFVVRQHIKPRNKRGIRKSKRVNGRFHTRRRTNRLDGQIVSDGCSVVTSVNHTSTRSKGTPAPLVVVASMESINQTCV